MTQTSSFTTTRRLISAQVAAILNKEADAPAIGIRADAPSDLGDTLRIDGRELPVARCESVLEVRERLASLDSSDGPLVIVTTLEDRELGFDVLARLAKRKLYSINPWQLVKEQFRAQDVDARIVERHPWVVGAILEAPAAAIVPPAPSGFLDAETVWKFLFGQLLGFPGGRRDPESILEWSLDERNIERLRQVAEDHREGLLSALGDDPLAAAMFGVVNKDEGVSALSIGLVARVLFDECVEKVAAAVCAARLEPLLTAPLDRDIALGWAESAEVVLARKLVGGVEQARPLLDAAEELVKRIGAEELVSASRFLLSSWEGRLDAYGEALESDLTTTSAAAERIIEHALADHSEKRVERVQMALRLHRWLEQPEVKTPSFAEASHAYRKEGGHVDWARANVWDGDGRPKLAHAYEELFSKVTAKREAENQRFGQLLAEWSRTGVPGDEVLPVEAVLDRVVAPLARECRTLLVVIDGMSVPVFRELLDDVLERGFTERVPDGEKERRPVISVLPTATKYSRSSLLCGKLVTGDQAREQAGFTSHPELRKLSKPEKGPLLFHKSGLRDAGSGKLASKLRAAVYDSEQNVVGVVINAVDDHLAKGDQVRVSWNCHTIRPLEELVDAARDAERAVVFVSDHGHIREWDLAYRKSDDSERWRKATGSPESDEVLLEGPRVLEGKEARVIAPWSEKVRYTGKKNGYHGGATPQEVVIPLAVVAPASIPEIEGWTEVSVEIPSWWSDEPVVVPVTPAPPKPRKKDKVQGELFGTAPGATIWLERLFASQTFQEQRERNKRVHLEDDRIREILLSLDERGKLTMTALAQRLGVASVRLPGILSALRRLLTVEGYDVVSVDQASDTVSFDRERLIRQFEIGEE